MHNSIVRKLLRTQHLPQMCMYCGEPADQREHVYPKCVYGENTPIVWSCGECNSIAGHMIFDGIEEKGEYIREELKKKYAKLFNYPDWDEEELEGLGYSLRKRVKSTMEKKKWIQKRLRWQTNPIVLIAMKYLKEKDTGKISAQTIAEINTIRPSELSLFVSINPEGKTREV